MKRLVLVRHGESEWNRQRRVQGQSGSGLSEVGRRQAQAVATWLAESHPTAARLVSSDLQRCRETVAPVAAALGLEPDFDPQLRERRFGRWEGRTLAEIERDDRDVWDRWRNGEDVVAELGGESSDRLGERVGAALERHLDAADDGDVVVLVAHGGTIWHGTHVTLGLRERVLGGVGNTAVTEIGVDGASRWLDAWNQTAHLPTDLRTTFRPSTANRAPAVGR